MSETMSSKPNVTVVTGVVPKAGTVVTQRQIFENIRVLTAKEIRPTVVVPNPAPSSQKK
jgi:hypothetical protein